MRGKQMLKSIESKKKKFIIITLVMAVCIAAAFIIRNAYLHSRYKYEVYTGGIEYDISLYKVRDGKNEKLAECSMSTKGELYCNNRKYTIDENESFIT